MSEFDPIAYLQEQKAKISKQRTLDWVKETSKIRSPLAIPSQEEEIKTTEVKPISNEPSVIDRYSNAFTSGLRGGLEKFGQAGNQFSEGKIGAGVLNTLTGAGLTVGSPIIGAFGVGSELAQDVFGKSARENLDAVLDPIGGGAKLLDKGFEKIGVDTKKIDESLGFNSEFGKAGKELTHLVGTGLAFGIAGKAIPKTKEVPNVPIRNVREEKIAEVKDLREKGYSETTEPVVAEAKRADVKSEQYGEPKRVEYEKEKTVTETADINRSRRTDVTDKYVEETKSQQVGETIKLPEDAKNTEAILNAFPQTKPAFTEKVLGEEFGGNSHLEIFENARKKLAPEKTIEEFMDVVQKDVDSQRQARLDAKVAEIKAKREKVIQEKVQENEKVNKRVYRQASLQEIDELVNPNTYSDVPMGTPQYYVSTSKDLALGQGKNKNGAIIEIANEGLDTVNPKNTKPGAEFVDSQKGGVEQILKAQPSEIKKNVVSIEIPKNIGRDEIAYKQRLKNVLKDWDKTETEKSTVYKNPKFNEEIKSPTLDRLKQEAQTELHKFITPEKYDQIKKDIISKTSRLFAGIDPTLIKDYAMVGLYHLEGGYRSFKAWAQKMNEDFGDSVNPYLRDIYKTMHKDYSQQVREFRKRTPLPLPEKQGTTPGYNTKRMIRGNEFVTEKLDNMRGEFDQIRNVTLTNEQTITAAKEHFKTLTDAKILSLEPGTAKNAVEITAMRMFTESRLESANKIYQEAKRSGNEDAINNSFKDFNKSIQMYAKVRGTLSTAAQAVQSGKIDMDVAVTQSMKDFSKAAREKGLNELADKLDEVLINVDNTTKWTDVASYVFYNTLLSNPLTQVANFLGNSSHMVTEITSRVFDPNTNKKALGRGLKKGITLGMREASEIAKASKSVEDFKFNPGFDWKPKSTIGKIGRDFLPTTQLAIVDGFFRGVARGMETEVVKQRLSKKYNESFKDVEKNIQEILKNPFTDNVKLQEYAKELQGIENYIDYTVFQQQLGKPGSALQNLINHAPLLKIVLPFVRVPINIMKVGFDWTPLGLAKLATKRGKQLSQSERNHIKRRALAGNVVTIGLLKAMSDGEIEITGQGPEDPRDRQLWEKLGYKPNHIYINGVGRSYQNVNPWNIQLALVGNLSDLIKYDTKYFADKEKSIFEKAGKVTLGFAASMTDQTFLQGLSSITQAMAYRDGKYFERLTVSMGVPNIMSFPKNVKEYWNDDKTVYYATEFSEMYDRKVGNTDNLIPRRTILGGEPRQSGFERLPFSESPIQNNELAKYFLDNGLRVSELKLDKNMESQTFNKYSQLAGKYIEERLTKNLNRIKALKEKDIDKAQDYIDDIVLKAKKKAKRQAQQQ